MNHIIGLQLVSLMIGIVSARLDFDEEYVLVATECNASNSTCFYITEETFPRNMRKVIHRRMELVNGEGFHHTSVELSLPQELSRKRINTRYLPINKEGVTTASYQIMISGGFLTESLSLENPLSQTQNLLNIGLGGGVIPNFFSSQKFDKMKINTTTVELDPFVAVVAKKWFGYEENERSHMIIDDGIEFVKKAKTEGRKFNTVILDACNNKRENLLYCPVEGFLEEQTIRNIADILEDRGSLIVNIVLWDNSNNLRHKVLNRFTRHFTSCNVLRANDSRILVCIKNRAILFKKSELQFLDNLKKADETFGFTLSNLL